jgi:amino acid permease
LLLYTVIVSIGISVDSVEAVFNIVGSVCSTSIGLILPQYFYFQLVIKKKKPLGIVFYLSVIVFSVMIPFAVFAVVSQYIK